GPKKATQFACHFTLEADIFGIQTKHVFSPRWKLLRAQDTYWFGFSPFWVSLAISYALLYLIDETSSMQFMLLLL
ncbi:MAG TPA: hypothetical protein VK558_13815, partial [Patescibacteria group bacterium]|nr:hypothetical protein [Patescibacteria group bacterium]